MNQRWRFCIFGVLLLSAISPYDAAQAQFAPDPFFYRKPHEIAPQKYQKQDDGTIFERKTGDIYDRKGNLLRRGNGESDSTPSGTYRLDSEDVFTFTNQNDPKVATGQYVNFGGTFSGKYTLPFIYSLGIPIKGTLNLNQNGNQVTGTLVTDTDRRADLRGVVQGSQLVGKLIFDDSCAGEGSLIADLSPAGDLMTGKYRVSDCNGKYSGRYKLKRS
jgi:hypothetical protein